MFNLMFEYCCRVHVMYPNTWRDTITQEQNIGYSIGISLAHAHKVNRRRHGSGGPDLRGGEGGDPVLQALDLQQVRGAQHVHARAHSLRNFHIGWSQPLDSRPHLTAVTCKALRGAFSEESFLNARASLVK